MRVVVYVEGPSDKLAMETLLTPLIVRKRNQGIRIEFFEVTRGNRKKTLVTQVPRKAAQILLNDPESEVVVMPDLYPGNIGFPHISSGELIDGVKNVFSGVLMEKTGECDERLIHRFHVFCFKHDLEVLLLAAHESLYKYLHPCSPPSWNKWRKPVENQNHNNPPKRVIECLFHECTRRYTGTYDTPLVLNAADYQIISRRCPQCFKPFVDFLESLQGFSP